MKRKASGQAIAVTSHVGRDLLAAAAAFKTEWAVTWEYVANSLQYIDAGTSPVISVEVNPKKKSITISDNGRGMSEDDLHHYFTMHAENRERRLGRPGRGKFGTGKSAAFGIGEVLRVDTVREGRRNVVELTRARINSSDGSQIPVDWLVKNESAGGTNGTIISIESIVLDRIETVPIIEYIERNLAYFRALNPQVAVGSHLCEFREPQVSVVHRFRPSTTQSKVVGDVELTIKVARAPLPEHEQGISVTAGQGNRVAVERAGVERKEMGAFLFGEVDVPLLEKSTSSIEPYDSSRSLQLNPKHPVVAVLIGFIGSRLEEVRSSLVTDQKKAQQSERARRLALESDRIAEFLNQDFEEQLRRLGDIKAATTRRGPASSFFAKPLSSDEQPTDWVEGLDKSGTLDQPRRHDTRTGQGLTLRDRPTLPRRGHPDAEGADSVTEAGGSGTGKRRPSGGFRVQYLNLGPDVERSRYDSGTLSILINLDHPVVAAAIGHAGVEDVGFRRLSYEIAFTEYSIALATEMTRRDPEIPADDLLYDIRATLNRLARVAVSLYRA